MSLAMPISITTELAMNRACLRDVIAQVESLHVDLQDAIDRFGPASDEAAFAHDELQAALLRREDMRSTVNRLEREAGID